jgi:uncharacterized membrane protein
MNGSSDQSTKLWLLIAAIGLAGLAVTTYLTANALSNTDVACSVGGCNKVLTSKWAKIFGIPVSGFGMVTYSTILLGALHAYQSPTSNIRGRLVSSITVVIGVIGSIYLTLIEIFVIKAACQYCITSAILVFVAAVVLWLITRREPALLDSVRRVLKR